MTSNLQGKTFSVFQQEIQEMKCEIRKYFHFDSKLWRAIQNHIWHVAQDNALIDWPEGFLIVVNRGTGAAITHLGCCIPIADYSVTPPKPSNAYVLDLDVSFINEEDRHMDYPPEKMLSYSLVVPIALEENFTQEGFDAWIAQEHKKKEAKTIKTAVERLNKLKKHPLWKKIQKASKSNEK
jgi:hypothetical protein